jgi:hypothetical protein
MDFERIYPIIRISIYTKQYILIVKVMLSCLIGKPVFAGVEYTGSAAI